MSLPALPANADTRSITERLNVLIRERNELDEPARIAQAVRVQTGAVATGTTQIPGDDSVPQSAEGDQYMALAITPKCASSMLVIEVTGVWSSTAPNGQLIVALFRDSEANALGAVSQHISYAYQLLAYRFTVSIASPGTASYTFKVRAGANSAATTTFNGTVGNRLMGGAMASGIAITEILP